LETGIALILVAFACIVLGALLATGTLKELTAKVSSAEIHVETEDEAGPAPRRRRRVHLWSEPSFQISVVFGVVLLALGVFVIVREQNVSIQERQAKISGTRDRNQENIGTLLTPTVAVPPSPRPAGTATPGPAPTATPPPNTAAEQLFKNAFQLDQQGKNDQAVAAYIAALDAGLREPQRSAARLELGLLSALEATELAKKGQKSQAQAPCTTAMKHLNDVLNSDAPAATKADARNALSQLKGTCT
jgi:hypothetical protein